MLGFMDAASLSLSAERARSLRQHLQSLCDRASLRGALILLDSGTIVAQSGEEQWRDLDEMGALATGAFFTSRELARRLGENEFTGLHYEGRQRHFFLAPLRQDFFLLCVFGNDTKLAVVRTCCLRQSAELLGELRAAMTESAPPESLPADGIGLHASRW